MTYFEILQFEFKLYENGVFTNTKGMVKNLNSYNTLINYKKLEKVVEESNLTKEQLECLKDYYLNQVYIPPRLLGRFFDDYLQRKQVGYFLEQSIED